MQEDLFRCNDCGAVFEKPKEIRENHGLDYGYELFYECPNCGSPDYDEFSNDEDNEETYTVTEPTVSVKGE